MHGAEPVMEPSVAPETKAGTGVTTSATQASAFSNQGSAFVNALDGLPAEKRPVAQALLAAKEEDGNIGGLLASPEGKFGGVKSVMALIAEFFGTMVFAWAGSTTPVGVALQSSKGYQPVNWGPWGNGITLAIVVFLTANVSGGHVNPAVTLATLMTGHINFLLGIAYIIAQIAGATTGLLLVVALVPTADVGMGASGPGCFHSGAGITNGQLFGWELLMTWVLVSVVYAVAIGRPSFGNAAPLAVGLTLFAMAFAGGSFSGTAINPARALAPAFVYHCYLDQVWIYILAEFLGGVIAGMMAGPLYGVRASWLKKYLPKILNSFGTGGVELQEPLKNRRQRSEQIGHLQRQLTGATDLERGHSAYQQSMGPSRRASSALTPRAHLPPVEPIPEGKHLV